MLSAVDWLVVAYGAGLALIGRWAAQRGRRSFLADRRVPAWAASFSVVATVPTRRPSSKPPAGVPGGLDLHGLQAGGAAGAGDRRAALPTRFYAAGAASIYGVLRQRYGEAAGRGTSLTFLGGRLPRAGAPLHGGHPRVLNLFHPRSSRSSPSRSPSSPRPRACTRCGEACARWSGRHPPGPRRRGGRRRGAGHAVGPARPPARGGAAAAPGRRAGQAAGLQTRPPRRTRGSRSGPAAQAPLFLVAAYAVDQDHVQRLMTCRTPREAL